MPSVSNTTPCPAKAASPWIRTGSTGYDPAGSIWSWRAGPCLRPDRIDGRPGWLGLAARLEEDVRSGRADVLCQWRRGGCLTSPETLHATPGRGAPSNSSEDRGRQLLPMMFDSAFEPAAVGPSRARPSRARRRAAAENDRRRGSGFARNSAPSRPRTAFGADRTSGRPGSARTPSAAFRRSEDAPLGLLGERGVGRPRPWTGCGACSSVSWMCMYSTPTVRQ